MDTEANAFWLYNNSLAIHMEIRSPVSAQPSQLGILLIASLILLEDLKSYSFIFSELYCHKVPFFHLQL